MIRRSLAAFQQPGILDGFAILYAHGRGEGAALVVDRGKLAVCAPRVTNRSAGVAQRKVVAGIVAPHPGGFGALFFLLLVEIAFCFFSGATRVSRTDGLGIS